MFKLVLKIIVFIALILAAGQIPVGKETIAAYYVIALDNITAWSVQKVKGSKVVAGIKAPQWVEDLFTRQKPAVKSENKSPPPKPRNEEPKKLPESKVNPSDRERLMRLLE